MKADLGARGVTLLPYDYMLFTNLFMMLTAAAVAIFTGEFQPGLDFCLANPEILQKILKFALCSAAGQSAIFFTIATFDPLVCSTVTTTRKVFSVLLSIFLHGHALNSTGWVGIALASCGILMELAKHSGGDHGKKDDKKKEAEQTAPKPKLKVATAATAGGGSASDAASGAESGEGSPTRQRLRQRGRTGASA
jgi:uncharacterized membrane protein